MLDKINFIGMFILNLSEKVMSFSPLLKLKNDQEFKWGDIQQKAFEKIKIIHEMSTRADPSSAR